MMGVNNEEIQALVRAYKESARDGNQILRRPEVQHLTGLSASTLYLRKDEGLWTPSISLGGQARGWPAFECRALLAAMVAGKSKEHIQAIVVALKNARNEIYRAYLPNYPDAA